MNEDPSRQKDIPPLSESSIDEMFIVRSDMGAEVMAHIAEQQYKEALQKMSTLVEMDEQLDGSISNANLLRFADIYAGLQRWGEAAESLLQLQAHIEVQIAEIEAMDEMGAAARITLPTLQQLLNNIIPARVRMYQDLGERIHALRTLVSDKFESMEKGDVRNVIQELRFNLALCSLPTALRPIITAFIEDLCEKNNASNKEFYRQADTVFCYLADYFGEIDPKNKRYFVDICMEMPTDPNFEDGRVAKTYNQLASEERISNRSQRVLRHNKDFIETNKEDFEKLEKIVDKFVSLSDSVAHESLPGALAEFVKREGIILK